MENKIIFFLIFDDNYNTSLSQHRCTQLKIQGGSSKFCQHPWGVCGGITLFLDFRGLHFFCVLLNFSEVLRTFAWDCPMSYSPVCIYASKGIHKKKIPFFVSRSHLQWTKYFHICFQTFTFRQKAEKWI